MFSRGPALVKYQECVWMIVGLHAGNLSFIACVTSLRQFGEADAQEVRWALGIAAYFNMHMVLCSYHVLRP